MKIMKTNIDQAKFDKDVNTKPSLTWLVYPTPWQMSAVLQMPQVLKRFIPKGESISAPRSITKLTISSKLTTKSCPHILDKNKQTRAYSRIQTPRSTISPRNLLFHLALAQRKLNGQSGERYLTFTQFKSFMNSTTRTTL